MIIGHLQGLDYNRKVVILLNRIGRTNNSDFIHHSSNHFADRLDLRNNRYNRSFGLLGQHNSRLHPLPPTTTPARAHRP